MWPVTQELSSPHCWPVFIISIHLVKWPLVWPQLPIPIICPYSCAAFRSAILPLSKYFCFIWCVTPELSVGMKVGSTYNMLALGKCLAIIYILSHIMCYTRAIYQILLASFYHLDCSCQTYNMQPFRSTILQSRYFCHIWYVMPELSMNTDMKSSIFHWIFCTKNRSNWNYTGQFFTNIILVKFDITSCYFIPHMSTISPVHRLNYYGEIWPVMVSQCRPAYQ
jgi:hypothetical protein